ncbi:alginate lyase family protein [Streptomyces sp. NPDC058045]|uniref:alginate lyase family protein n=1 Tax=Streptomyces sp. NPDC058045 TaxID=3346311 RepID=UPI0036E1D8D9
MTTARQHPRVRLGQARGPGAPLVLLLVPLLVSLLASCGTLPGASTTAHAKPVGNGDFHHPGVVVSKAQLDTARDRVNAGKQPWLSSYLAMRDSKYGSLAYRATPFATVQCPPDTRPGHGCVEERQDAVAAYTQALLWYITRDRQHAAKAEQIMDAWSAEVKRHTDGNAGLQTAWAGSTWARAAEIVRHTGAGWPEPRVHRFETMLRTAYLPEVDKKVPDYNGNWDLAMTDAAIAIAVFLDDHRTFDTSLARFKSRVPAYFYLSSDGKSPRTVPGSSSRTPRQIDTYWFGQNVYADGLGQETCRNFMHVGYSLAATGHIAETAWHQGVDLYSGVKDRLKAALEFHSRYQLGARAPGWLCGGKVERTLGPDLEVDANHLENRLHLSLPQTDKLNRRTRPAGTDDLFVAWETLTHDDSPGK